MTSAMPMVAPAGGTKPLFGTNPLSFAWPRQGNPPMVFDMATAAMARGEIQVAAREGHTVRDGAGIDKDGNPTNDPNAILEGAQFAFGGTKGALLALMIELMSGPMLGEPFSVEQKAGDNGDGGPATGGELLIAIDPVRLSGDRVSSTMPRSCSPPSSPSRARVYPPCAVTRFALKMKPTASKSRPHSTTRSRSSANATSYAASLAGRRSE